MPLSPEEYRSLDSLEAEAERYWRAHLPTFYRELEEKGELLSRLKKRAAEYSRKVSEFVEDGLPPWQAEELSHDLLFMNPEALGEPDQEPDDDQVPDYIRLLSQPLLDPDEEEEEEDPTKG